MLPNMLPNLYIILFFVVAFLFLDWWSKMIFIACAYCKRYRHGKSWNRAHKHYKMNWSLLQRMLWIPAFREHYEGRYRLLAYSSYLQLILTIVTVILFCNPTVFVLLQNSKVLGCYVFGHFITIVLRIIYNDFLASGKI